MDYVLQFLRNDGGHAWIMSFFLLEVIDIQPGEFHISASKIA